MDNQYSLLSAVTSVPIGTKFDMHEFEVDENGSMALFIYDGPGEIASGLGHVQGHSWSFADAGIAEVDTVTNDVHFTWRASERIPYTASRKAQPHETVYGTWDWLWVVFLEFRGKQSNTDKTSLVAVI